MPFRFPLRAVLRLRQSMERRERLLLEALAARCAAVAGEIEAVEIAQLAARNHVSLQLLTGMTSAELHFEQSSDDTRAALLLTLAQTFARLEAQRASQLLRYLHARRDARILENLRQRLFELYTQWQNRREQQRVDELFLLHRSSDARQDLPTKDPADPAGRRSDSAPRPRPHHFPSD